MTLSLRTVNLPDIHKFAVGFEKMFDDLTRHTTQPTNYPPYNIIKKSSNQFAIQLAVAGFKEGDLEVTTEENQLTVKGNTAIDVIPEVEYLHRGISSRNFTRTWSLAEHVVIAGAKVQDGILTIDLDLVVPEEKKPRKIPLTFTK